MADDYSLDVPEPQILLHFAGDPNGLTEHHRLLLAKLNAGRWVAATPDFDLEVLDLNVSRHTVLRRKAVFPAHLSAAVYAFDPLSRRELEDLRQQAKSMAMILGDAPVQEAETSQRVFADPKSERLGRAVTEQELQDATTIGDKGLVEIDGVVEWIQDVPHSDLASFAEKVKGSLGDLRTLGVHKDAQNKRYLSLSDAYPMLRQSSFDDWGFAGPRAALEFLGSIREGTSDLPGYHLQWLQHSGVNSRSAVAHEHKTILEAVRLGICRDQLDISNLLSFELLIRRAIQLEMAVARCPSNPEFSGLEALMESPITSGGSASTRAVDSWLTDRLKEKAQIQKQARLYREEMSHGARDKGSSFQGDDADGPGGKWRRKKKTPKPKAGAGAGGSGAAE